MTLSISASGSQLTTASEVTINEITSDDLNYWGAMIFVPAAFTGTDSATIKFYVYDTVPTAATRIQYVKSFTGSQAASPSFYIPLVPTTRYKITIQRTAGSDRTFTWLVLKQTG